MSFVYKVSEQNNTLDSPDQDSVGWNVLAVAAINVTDAVGYIFTLLGFLFNYFCYITASHLPESTSATLMKYVAVWDTISLLKIGLFDGALRKFGLRWELYSVRYFYARECVCMRVRVCVRICVRLCVCIRLFECMRVCVRLYVC